MAYVVTDACVNHKHTNCVDVCPVDAFREGENMLYIDPKSCIDCNACVTECPEQAIFPQSAVPKGQLQYIEINAQKAKNLPVIRESVFQAAASAQSALAGRFAVVGAGPSGFYTAEAILKNMPSAKVDIFERLPTPFGLVRYGVAPDHPRIKSVSASFERIAENPQVRFFGNVQIAQDISTFDLKSLYHSVVYATGGSKSRLLSIPGADLDNIFGSSDFVGWYNGHPDNQALTPKLDSECAAVIGMGNVALDIARILILPYENLAKTDIADPSLFALKDSKINEICLLARRGAVQAALTPKELEQLIALDNLDLIVNPADLTLDAESEAELAKPEFSEARQNMELLRQIAQRPLSNNPDTKRIRFMFLTSPESITEANGSKQLNIVRNELSRDEDGRVAAVATDKKSALQVGLIINATGYQGTPITGLPFDERLGVITHQASRIASDENKEYVAGWIKRGASGVIGSNKQCASDTVKQLLSALPAKLNTIAADVAAILTNNKVEFISFADWQLLDHHEQTQGAKQGRPRRKETDVATMLNLIKEARAAAINKAEAQGKLAVQTHFRSCTLCEAMCGVEIKYQGDKIIAISGDDKDQHSWGHICPKGYSLQDIHNDPDRLKKPLRKVGGQWLEVEWEEALDYAAQGLVKVQAAHGNDAVGGYWGNPTSHNLGLLMATNKLRKVLKSKNMFSAASLDQMPHQLCSYLMFGHGQVFTIPDVDHTDYMLMLGANPAASNGSLMSGGDILKRLKGIHERGGKLVLIDPRKNESANYAQEHHFIRPATDALFLVGLIQHVIRKELYKPGKLKEIVDHWDELPDTFNLFPMPEIAELTGIAQSEIERIAEEFAAAPAAICYGRMGISAQTFGALNHYLINTLNIITGNLDRRGGMMFTKPAVDSAVKAHQAGSFNTYQTRVRKLPEFNREFPATAMAEEMTTAGEGQIRGFVCIAGNPGLSTPNARLLEKGLSELDFMVSLDFYLNETSRHADIILPPTGPLEHEQYDLVFNLLSVHNVAKFSEPLFPHEPGTLSDWDIMNGLIGRLDKLKTGNEPKPQAMSLVQMLDYALKAGPYGEGFDEYQGDEVVKHHSDGMSLEKLKEFPNGLNLGPLQPCLPEFLFTEDKKIHTMPEPFIEDLARLKTFAKALQSKSELKLIGRRDLRTNNSWMHNSQRLVKGKDRCGLFMHPMDAEKHNLTAGSKAKIASRVGELNVVIEVTATVMPGVVCLPHGWGHDLEGVELRVAKTNPGINSNDLTDDRLVDELSGNAVLNGIPVKVTAL